MENGQIYVRILCYANKHIDPKVLLFKTNMKTITLTNCKQIILAILFQTIIFGHLFAQSANQWLEYGTEWHNSVWYWLPGYPVGFNHFYYTKDTLINNRIYQQVKGEQQLRTVTGNNTYLLGDTTFLSKQHFITSQDTVYLLKAELNLQFLWYNNPDVGDIWDFGTQFDNVTNSYRNAYSQVDSIKLITINGEQLKQIFSHSCIDTKGTPTQFGDSSLFVNHIEIINTKFGPVSGFNLLGTFTSSLTTDAALPDKLLCFQSYVFPFYQVLPTTNCNNNILTGTQAEWKYKKNEIFPNPFQSSINIQNIPKECSLTLFDCEVRLLMQKKTHGDSEMLNLIDLPDGIYFIKLIDNQGQIIYLSKIIKR